MSQLEPNSERFSRFESVDYLDVGRVRPALWNIGALRGSEDLVLE